MVVCREIKDSVKEGTQFKLMQRDGEEGETVGRVLGEGRKSRKGGLDVLHEIPLVQG